jgi:hypothetical protein
LKTASSAGRLGLCYRKREKGDGQNKYVLIHDYWI